MFRSQAFEIVDEPLDADEQEPTGRAADKEQDTLERDATSADPGRHPASEAATQLARHTATPRWPRRGLTVCALVAVAATALGLVDELGHSSDAPDAARRVRPDTPAPTVALPEVRDRRRPLARSTAPRPRARQKPPRRPTAELPVRPDGLAPPSTQTPAPKRLPRPVRPRPPVKPAAPVPMSPEFL